MVIKTSALYEFYMIKKLFRNGLTKTQWHDKIKFVAIKTVAIICVGFFFVMQVGFSVALLIWQAKNNQPLEFSNRLKSRLETFARLNALLLWVTAIWAIYELTMDDTLLILFVLLTTIILLIFIFAFRGRLAVSENKLEAFGSAPLPRVLRSLLSVFTLLIIILALSSIIFLILTLIRI